MCGIVGIWRLRGGTSPDLQAQIERAVATLTHRGPDDQGVWVDEGAGLALGQRRLAILDLSAAGHQPMFSADGRLVLVYNGEVYNFQDLREELRRQGYQFVSDTDTEVILAAFAAWGVEQAVSLFVGMFALALWDRQEGQLWLVRDRLGIKPLYFHYSPGLVLFASELKAIMSWADFPRDLDFDSLAAFFRYLYIPAPRTIFQQTKKLHPGQYARIDRNGLELKQYWDPRRIAHEGLQRRLNLSDMEAEEELERLIRQSVRLRMIADVPLGAFLSGGIDSSTVVSAMQAEASAPVKTFTICFTEEYYDEGRFARRVASHLGTEHTELYVTPEMTQAVIPLLPRIYDEPFADPSAIPTFLVSRLARQKVTVSLSGDGGDELFGGYLRYYRGRELWRLVKNLPPRGRVLLAELLGKIPAQNLEKFFLRIRPYLPTTWQYNLVIERLWKVAALLRAETELEVYRQVASFWHDPRELLLGKLSTAEDDLAGALAVDLQSLEMAEKMMLIDLQTYLPEDILTKLDRASMMVSLEARVPLLDHRLVAWAWRLPLHLKIRNGQGKWLLRRVLSRYVPPALFERAKSGFSIPIGPWLRNSLKDWGEELLDSKALKEEGILNPELVRQCWEEHQSGTRNNQSKLWPVLMFRAWKQRWLG